MTLTFDLLTLNFYGTSDIMRLNSVQYLSEINNLRLSYWRFSMFCRAILWGWDTFPERFSGVRGPNFTKLWEDIGRSWLHKKFVWEFGFLAVFSNSGGSDLSDILNVAKFRTIWPSVKIRGWVGEIFISIVEALITYDRTSEIHLMAIHCAAAEHGGLIKNKERKWRKFMGKT